MDIDIDQDYDEILNTVERHTMCREGACLRKKRERWLASKTCFSGVFHIENKFIEHLE